MFKVSITIIILITLPKDHKETFLSHALTFSRFPLLLVAKNHDTVILTLNWLVSIRWQLWS